MKKMNKFFAAAVMLAVAASATAAAKPKASTADSSKLKIVTTIFPEYDWTKQILGDKAKDADLTLLLDNGVDLHSYQPTVQDIAKISNADIFIYVGGESDEWVEDVLRSAQNKHLVSVNLLEVLGDRVKAEEVVEGMEAEHHHDEEEHHHHHDGEEHHHDDDDEEEEEMDEHVWLSLRNAQFICNAICETLCAKDSANAAAYRANCAAYTKKLADLDAAYSTMTAAAKRRTVLFGDRFPFRYLTDDYGLTYYAAFTGCSAESEASFKTIAFLSQKMDELDLQHVMQIESGKGKIARTIIQNSKNKKAKILTIDSMQSTTARDIKKGATYLSIMQKNLEVLKTALN